MMGVVVEKRAGVMLIARVIGTVVATRKHERLVGSKIQVVQPLEPKGQEPYGDPFVAVDAVGAGLGELVLTASGSSARMTTQKPKGPIDTAVVAIVDYLDRDGKMIYRKEED